MVIYDFVAIRFSSDIMPCYSEKSDKIVFSVTSKTEVS